VIGVVGLSGDAWRPTTAAVSVVVAASRRRNVRIGQCAPWAATLGRVGGPECRVAGTLPGSDGGQPVASSFVRYAASTAVDVGCATKEPTLTEPATPAIEAIEAAGVPHRVVRTERASSAEESASFQGIAPGALLRTIVVRRGDDDYLFVLVPADRRFDWPKLRAHLGVRRLTLPDADEARAATGYERYTITPFGASRAWPVILDASAVDHPVVSIGGGGFGVNLHLAPADLVAALRAEVVDVSEVAPVA
jgi:Cys-tRNA(Pro)/Cys-tRNA(Cys) deacylase